MSIAVQRLDSRAVQPKRAHSSDAGYDLVAIEKVWLRPGEHRLVRTGIAVSIPEGFYGRIADRSGLAFKRGLHVLAGVIDSGYRGEIGVVLLNTSGGADHEETVCVEAGERCAQLIIERTYEADFTEVESLDVSERSVGGFGSSG